jgi:uncharacterized protein
MNQYLVAFITGLTTGGLSCLAVQGGLLASSLERQMEQDLLSRPALTGKKHARAAQRARSLMALPILLFLGAKVMAYTLLGLLLGALGSVLQLNTAMRAILLIAIGIFMVGNALRMFNVHPIFRYFVIEPPKFITRYIRRTSNSKDGAQTHPYIAPLFLGALTVLIPCGVTQAMMAVAMGTGDPWQAAGLMLAFTLGTSPVFFAVSYLATELGARMESIFMRLVAVVVLVLGLVSVDSGFALMGAPSVMGWTQSLMEGQPASAVAPADPSGALVLNATNNGYSPRTLHAKADAPLKLNMVTKNTYSCARGFVIPVLNVEELLPANGTVVIDIPAQKPGTVMPFTCSMGMYTGEIVFDQ